MCYVRVLRDLNEASINTGRKNSSWTFDQVLNAEKRRESHRGTTIY